MKKFFQLCRNDKDNLFAVAYSDEDTNFDRIGEGIHLANWQPITLSLKGTTFTDYLANDLDWPLCSSKLKKVIDDNISPSDSIQWLDIDIRYQSDQIEKYHILNLPLRPDVLDEQMTLYVDDFVVKPIFSSNKIGSHKVFSYSSGEFSVIVSEEVKDAIVSTNCTGIIFLQVPITP
jgi:hypothetical protein